MLRVILFLFLIDIPGAKNGFAQSSLTPLSDPVHRRSDGEIYLRLATCEQAKMTVQDLQRWTRKLTQETMVNPVFTLQSDGSCQAIVTSQVPPFVRTYLGQNLGLQLNCFPVTLMANGMISSATKPMLGNEMQNFLKKPFCTQLSADQAREPGDIGVVKKKKSFYHAFTYINSSLTFSKESFLEVHPISFKTPEDEIRRYKEPEFSLTYYRCLTRKEYLRQNPRLSTESACARVDLKAADCDRGHSAIGVDRKNVIDILNTAGLVE